MQNVISNYFLNVQFAWQLKGYLYNRETEGKNVASLLEIKPLLEKLSLFIFKDELYIYFVFHSLLSWVTVYP